MLFIYNTVKKQLLKSLVSTCASKLGVAPTLLQTNLDNLSIFSKHKFTTKAKKIEKKIESRDTKFS